MARFGLRRIGLIVGVVDALVKAGIPEEEIVLGFHPPDARQHTEFAVA